MINKVSRFLEKSVDATLNYVPGISLLAGGIIKLNNAITGLFHNKPITDKEVKIVNVKFKRSSLQLIPVLGNIALFVHDVKQVLKKSHQSSEKLPQSNNVNNMQAKTESNLDGDELNELNELGMKYEEGRGVEKDLKKALEYYEKAAEKGSNRALNSLGAMYEEGLGVEKDFKKAFEYYQKAADNGDYAGFFNLAGMYREGRGVEKDFKKALEYYEKVAKETGDNDAWHYVGEMYDGREGVDKKFL